MRELALLKDIPSSTTSPPPASASSTARPCSTWPTTRTRAPSRHELREDRRRPLHRAAGHRRGLPFDRRALDALMGLRDEGIRTLIEKQKSIVGDALKK
jgi:hypothetical protein